ncbi:trichohyalin-like [Macrobrachium nipponense]|uniref:trichohyalin-like n=1 Tax=Macrobrachium nipponense TaxID=159736 RepID=UPI0030C7EB3A
MFTIVKEKEEQLREATNITERMIAIVKEKDDMVRNMMILYDNLKKEKDFQIHDLMAEQEKLKNDHRILEEKLEDALSKREKELEEAHNSIQDMERLLKEEGKEKRELTNLYNKMVENKDHQIRDILAKEDKLKAAKELSQEKLEELANRMQDLESLLKEKEEEKTEMTSLYDKIIATREQQIKDLLAKEDKLKEEQETLQEKLGKALSCLKRRQDFKIEIERRWLLEMREKNRELDMLRKLCEEYDERQRNLEEKLGEDLNEMQKLGLSLKKAEDSLTETCWLVKEKEEALVKVRSRCEEQDTGLERLRQQGIHLQGKLQKKEVDYESLSVQRNELETLLNTEKELLREREREITDLKMRYQQILLEKEQQEKSLLEENDCLQKEVASLQVGQVVAMSNEEKLKGELKFAEEKVLNFLMAEKQNLHTIEKLTKECELLKEKCRTLEGSKAKAEKCAREQQRMQEEALRMQDKYMLMGLLHRIAQRDFELERIAGEEHEITEAEGEKPETESEDLVHENNQEFSNAQDENRGYLRRQWLDVTSIVEDILYRDQRPPEEERDVEPNH